MFLFESSFEGLIFLSESMKQPDAVCDMDYFLKLLPQESRLQTTSQIQTSDDASLPSRCTGLAFKMHPPSPHDFCVWPPGFASTITPTASTASWPPKTLSGPQLRAVCSYRALQGQWNCPSSVSLCSWIHSWLRRAGSEMIRNHISSDNPCQLPQSKYCFGNIIYH